MSEKIESLTTKPEAVFADKLVKYFGQGNARVLAIDHACLSAAFGEILFIIGPSDSGKTTFLSIISGILRPDGGVARVNGVNRWSLPEDQLADFRLNTIGFVFQDYHLFPRLTSAENVAIPLILKNVDWKSALASANMFLDVVGLKGRGDVLPFKLSGGEQQRVPASRIGRSGPGSRRALPRWQTCSAKPVCSQATRPCSRS